jgi:hypothetical protein
MLRLTIVILSLIALPLSAYAATCSNGISPDRTQNRVGYATCFKCSSISGYALYGGALLQNNHARRNVSPYNIVVVNNGRGSRVEVTTNQLSSGTGISFSFSLFSFEIRQGNRAAVGVTATPLTGGVSGAPWNRQPTNKGQLRQVCSAIDREKEVREAKDFYKDQLKLGVINFGSFTVGGELNAFSNSAYNRFSTFSSSGLSPHGFPVITTESVF